MLIKPIDKSKRTVIPESLSLGSLFVAVVVLLGPSLCHAYIDPGTGMAFVSGIGAWLAAFFALFFGVISLTFKRWIGWVKKRFCSIKNLFSPK